MGMQMIADPAPENALSALAFINVGGIVSGYLNITIVK